VLEAGTGGGARRGGAGEPGVAGPAFGKTGTTDGERDVWFVGATPAGAAALWLGYDAPTGVGASASQLAAPLWGWWMRRIGAGMGGRGFAGGVELSHRWICATTGRLAGPNCRALRAPFLPGSAPASRCHEDHPERLLELLEQGTVPGLPAE
jgi:penicillin-binding protein 1A